MMKGRIMRSRASMLVVKNRSSRTLGLLLSCLVILAAKTPGQEPAQAPQQAPDDVIRVDTTLVQTDVMVFDKKGHFVDGLKPDQFELKIDNKPRPIAFFERIASGSL